MSNTDTPNVVLTDAVSEFIAETVEYTAGGFAKIHRIASLNSMKYS